MRAGFEDVFNNNDLMNKLEVALFWGEVAGEEMWKELSGHLHKQILQPIGLLVAQAARQADSPDAAIDGNRAMSRGASPFGPLSYLDLICGSLGAAVLMLLIAAAADPAGRRNADSPAVLVTCRHSGGAWAEVGIEFLRPDGAS